MGVWGNAPPGYGMRFIALAVAALLVWLDQWVKAWALAELPARIPVIPGLFYFTYLENTGAAFGLFQGHAFILAIISLVILGVLFVLLLTGKIKERILIWGCALVFAGGVGNCIDRLTHGFVIDYLDFSALFGFPVFNLADCFVVIGVGLIMVYLIFIEGKQPTPGGGGPNEKDKS